MITVGLIEELRLTCNCIEAHRFEHLGVRDEVIGVWTYPVLEGKVQPLRAASVL